MGALVSNNTCSFTRLCPVNSISDYTAYIRVVIGFAGFMSGLKVEDLSGTTDKAGTGAEYVAIFKPAAENQSVGLRNIKWFGI